MSESKIDPHEIAARWKTRGFSFGVFTGPSGQVWENFVHDTDELLMVIKGEMELSMQGRTIRCEIGKEILIPAGVVQPCGTLEKPGRSGFMDARDSRSLNSKFS